MQRYDTGKAEKPAWFRTVLHGSEKFRFVRFFLINKNAETQRRGDFLSFNREFLECAEIWLNKKTQRRGDAEIPFFFENEEFTEFLCLMSHP